MIQLFILFDFFMKCLASIPIDVGILYNNEDPLTDIALRHIEVRYKLMTNYSLRAQIINTKDLDCFTIENSVCKIIENGVHAIIGPTTEETNSIVQSISENFELPQLQTFWNPALGTTNNASQIMNLYPEPTLLGKAIATLVKAMNWRSFAVIYEDDESLKRLQEVLKLQRAQANHFPVTIRRLLEGDDQSILLKKIKDGTEIHVILDCKTDKILNILHQAQKINMLESFRSYLLTSLDAHTLDFSDLTRNNTNITTLRMLATNSPDFRNAIKDWEFMEQQAGRSTRIKPESIKLSTALLYDALECFLSSFMVLSLTSKFDVTRLSCDKKIRTPHGLQIGEYLRIRPLYNGTLAKPLTGSIEFDDFGKRKNFKLQIVDVYNLTLRLTGEWSSDEPDRIKYLLPSANTAQVFTEVSLYKGALRIASKTGAPYFMENRSNITGNIIYEGYVVDLIDAIAHALNFTYEFYVAPDNTYGRFDQGTKEWNGLMKEIIDRKADLAVCDLTITYERGSAVDFSVPFMTLGISILYSKAAKKPPDLLSFMQPLSLDIWLYMATAYLAVSILIYFTARLTPREWESSHPCDNNPSELENIWNIKNTFWLTLGSIMAQGCDLMPKGMSTRMITSIWWFFSLILTSSYTANLAAFLTNERMGPTIESADDLARQTDIKYGCVEGGATATFFRDSNFQTYQRMWRTMEQAEPTVFQTSNKDGVKAVKTRKRMYAFLMESSSIDYERERDCDLIEVGEWLDTKGYGIAMSINSPYRTPINAAILKLQEDGSLQKLKDKWWKRMHGGGKCQKSEDSDDDDEATELGIDNVGGVFVVLTGGVILAFFIAIVEFLWNVRKISVADQMTPAEAFTKELKFALKLSDSKKHVCRKKMPPEEPQI